MLDALMRKHPSLPLAAMRLLVMIDSALDISQRLGDGWTLALRSCFTYLRYACALTWSAAMLAHAPVAGTGLARGTGVLATFVSWALFDASLAYLEDLMAAQTAACMGATLALLMQRPSPSAGK